MSLKNILLYISLVFAVTACVSPTTQYPGLTETEIAQERKIQEQLSNEQNSNVVKTSANNSANHKERLISIAPRISQAGSILCENMGITGCNYKYALEKADSVNAYADGKNIVMSEGMMAFANDNQVALVLAHEFAHNMMGHIDAKKQNIGVGSIVGTLLDSLAQTQGVNTGGQLSSLGSQAGSIRYSKEFEKEADYVGLYITDIAGFDISSSPDFWRKMSKLDKRSIYGTTTHPTNPERYIGLAKTIKEINEKKKRGAKLVPNIEKKK